MFWLLSRHQSHPCRQGASFSIACVLLFYFIVIYYFLLVKNCVIHLIFNSMFFFGMKESEIGKNAIILDYFILTMLYKNERIGLTKDIMIVNFFIVALKR